MTDLFLDGRMNFFFFFFDGAKIMSIYRKVVKGFIIVVVGGGVIMERCLISGRGKLVYIVEEMRCKITFQLRIEFGICEKKCIFFKM